MALIVENGSGVAGADSYISLADARAILTPLGQDLNAVDATAEIQLRKSVVWLESFWARFIGRKTLEGNPLQWPRIDVVIYGFHKDSDFIPDELKKAQVYAAYELEQGGDLQENTTGESTKREKVDVIETEFFNTGSGSSLSVFTRVNEVLSPLLNNSGLFNIRGQRG